MPLGLVFFWGGAGSFCWPHQTARKMSVLQHPLGQTFQLLAASDQIGTALHVPVHVPRDTACESNRWPPNPNYPLVAGCVKNQVFYGKYSPFFSIRVFFVISEKKVVCGTCKLRGATHFTYRICPQTKTQHVRQLISQRNASSTLGGVASLQRQDLRCGHDEGCMINPKRTYYNIACEPVMNPERRMSFWTKHMGLPGFWMANYSPSKPAPYTLKIPSS